LIDKAMFLQFAERMMEDDICSHCERIAAFPRRTRCVLPRDGVEGVRCLCALEYCVMTGQHGLGGIRPLERRERCSFW
jgi:hypothetical protein